VNDSETNQYDDAVSPRIGIVYKPIEPISLYANYARSFTPSFATDTNGDPLEPEVGEGFEVGIRGEIIENRLTATFAYFDITKQNVATADPVIPFASVATGEQRSRGVDFNVTGEILPGWNVIASYAYINAEITEDNTDIEGNRLRGVPENSASLWTTYEIQSGDLQGLGFGLGLNFVGERQGDLANSFQADGYFLTNAAIFYRREGWQVRLNVDNLFDIDYIESVSNNRVRGIYPGDPLTVRASVCGQPERIVVLGPYVLEYLIALDVQPIGYADHVAFHQGEYTNPSQQIPYLGNRITPPLANVGTAFSPSLEAILKLQPDLIVGVADNNTDQYETLSGIAPTLLINYFDSAESLRAIAQATNQTEQVEQLIEQRQQQLALAQEDFAPLVATHPKVLLLSSSELQEVRLESPAGYCSSLLEELGFQRVSPPGVDADSIASVPISLETLPQLNDADLIILFGTNFTELQQFTDSDNFEDHQLSDLKQAWEENAIAQSLNASKADHVYFIPAYLCRGLPGPIGTELYLNELQRQLLPTQ